MSTADFLLELRCEEIPARMQAGARNELAKLLAVELDGAGLRAEAIDVWSTPRRLALIARGLPTETRASSEEVKGPRVGAPPKALEGFLRKTGLTQDQLTERDNTWFARIEKPGQPTAALLGAAIERIVRAFPWPKSMRWGEGALRWVRPLHGIVAILGEDIVPVNIDGIESGATTLGHRFHHAGPITIGGASDYAEKLRACHVIVDQDEREKLIRAGAEKAAADAGLKLLADEGLVVENAGLTEWPVPLVGRFDPEFLDVPREVIVLTMRTNQKYFACADDSGALAPAFVCIANIAAKDGGEAIIEGNRRVLAARLADARFFWEQDLKVPLEDFLPKLEPMLFYEGMGSLRAKAERTAVLSKSLCERWFPERDPETAYRAGLLAKADLASAMVGEFPELQGIMGGYYAERGGEKPGIVSALQQQYRQSVEGCIPVCVALADRIDTLASFFARGIRPTGSKDPFALRRSALGIIQTILVNGTRMSLREAFRMAEARVDTEEMMDFFADRLKVQQREAGVRHDFIDAVFALSGEDDLVRLLARVNALQGFVETKDGADLLTAYKRAANILRKENWDAPSVMTSPEEQGIPQTGEEDPFVLVDEEPEIVAQLRDEEVQGHSGSLEEHERALVEALDAAEPQATSAVEQEDFAGAMAALASLRRPIDGFFDHVTVNDPDQLKRTRRLNLLARFRDAVHRVADFSKIEG